MRAALGCTFLVVVLLNPVTAEGGLLRRHRHPNPPATWQDGKPQPPAKRHQKQVNVLGDDALDTACKLIAAISGLIGIVQALSKPRMG
jgi:hypothetical protein